MISLNRFLFYWQIDNFGTKTIPVNFTDLSLRDAVSNKYANPYLLNTSKNNWSKFSKISSRAFQNNKKDGCTVSKSSVQSKKYYTQKNVSFDTKLILLVELLAQTSLDRPNKMNIYHGSTYMLLLLFLTNEKKDQILITLQMQKPNLKNDRYTIHFSK